MNNFLRLTKADKINEYKKDELHDDFFDDDKILIENDFRDCLLFPLPPLRAVASVQPATYSAQQNSCVEDLKPSLECLRPLTPPPRSLPP